MTTVTVIRSDYATRRYERRAAFLAKKQATQKLQSRSVEEIIDSIIKPVDEIDVLTQLMIGLKKDIKDDNGGSCCMSEVALYSTKQRANRILESGGVTARG
ncbi:hypothetical protein KKJ13_19945 [Xenorhabdus bovienii]|uniref:hypothetical protein n=1 Tax=Xenorhabdus bovienii TaxID=40576 RepID=UPI0023B32AE9|nr:hypothetical protein [Xenorhabdus bovienii]MDE9443804.1 hypothetical protein [Xenorhabdus bovienii]